MRVLLALGGNAMTAPDGSATPQAQIAAITTAMESVAALVAEGHEMVLTHGNGPQVGNLLVKNELAAQVVPPVPLDWCGAQTQGTIGFVVLNALETAFAARRIDTPVAAVVCRTLVDVDDEGFRHPTKPIGRYLPREQAQRMVEHGQTWEDRGERGWRRVVASPEPLEVLDTGAVRTLVEAGYAVVAAGGGGIPVVREPSGRLRGVEAVIDKDLTAAVLAEHLEADFLMILSDVANVYEGYGTDDARAITRATPRYMRDLGAPAGSMGPKIEAICRFVELTGGTGAIGRLEDAVKIVQGDAGTIITPGGNYGGPDDIRPPLPSSMREG